MTPRTSFKPVTAEKPCPVCNGNHKCARGDDGLICCGRASGDAEGFKHLGASEKDPQWNLYRRSGEMCDATPRPNPQSAAPAVDWGRKAEEFAKNLDDDGRAGLATRLGLPVDCLDALPLIGADATRAFWTFPECDAAGNVIGINRRFRDGGKKVMAGGARGLTIPRDWRDGRGPVLLVEGASDVLALSAVGLSAVGRPSNLGGVDQLAVLLADLPADREVIVIGENDQKDDGKWPGREGAVRTATALAEELRRPVSWALTPDGAKDPREWFRTRRELFLDVVFLNALQRTVVEPGGPIDADAIPERDDDPHRLARLFAASYRTPDGERTLVRWQSQFYRWSAGAYVRLPEETVRAELTAFIRAQFERDFAAAARDDDAPATVRPVRQGPVSDVLGALIGDVAAPTEVNPPGWLDGAPATGDIVNTPNAIVNLSALAGGRPDAVRKPTPKLFATTKTGAGYDPNAPAPAEWLKFLNELWPNDPDSIACLQQWFGYLLTADNRQQKMLLLVGPPRSGKGTIAGVLRALLGEGSVAGPTLNSLSTNFGLSPLLDRSVAIVDDARLSGRTDAAAVAERLLTITGDGLIDVDRKHLPAVAGAKLGTRFVVISNELPKLGDASGALVGRMIVLRFTRSFFGNEDHGLKERLLKELPGILLWAIEGWKQLRERGRFTQPTRGQELVDELLDLSSPVGAFVREQCRTGPRLTVPTADLFAAWKRYCETIGRREAGTEQTFGRDLRAVVPELEMTRPRVGGARARVYVGIALRSPGDADHIADHDEPERSRPDDSHPTTEPPKRSEPGRSANWSASGPRSGPHGTAENPGMVRMVRDLFDLSESEQEETGSEAGSEESSRAVQNTADHADHADHADRTPAELAARLLAAGPLDQAELAAGFVAAGFSLDDAELALKAVGAIDARDPDGEWRYRLPGART